MDPLLELSDLIAGNPTQFSEKLTWLCNRCPSPASLLASSPPTVTRSHLAAVLAVARFLSKCPNPTAADHHRPQSLVLAFLHSIPASFTHSSFWPQSFNPDSISSFYADFLGYVSKAAESSPAFAADVAGLVGEVLESAVGNNKVSGGELLGFCNSRAFLRALSRSFLPITPSGGDKLISCLLDRFVSCDVPSSPVNWSCRSSPNSAILYQLSENSSPRNEVSNNSSGLSSNSASKVADDSPNTAKQYQLSENSSLRNGVSSNSSGLSSSSASKAADDALTESSKASITNGSNVEQVGTSISTAGFNDGGGGGGGSGVLDDRQLVVSFEKEPIESLEKKEIAFELIACILDKVKVDPKVLEQVRIVAKDQLKLMSSFLKIRRWDWREQGQPLKHGINAKLSVFKAAVLLNIKSLASLDFDGKLSNKLLLGTFVLLVEAAEACLFLVWRKLRACEELFSSLLDGITKIAVTRGGQLLRVLLIHLKPLVLATCAQADTWGNSQGAMFESVLRTSCEILEFGWTKDRSPVDTFIMGLATSIRERNDYEEEEGKEKLPVPVVQLNVVRLLADLNASVKKPEVVDMILPLFIESLEEGDASTPGLLRLRVRGFTSENISRISLRLLLDAVSRLASLGFETSYRETVVLMTRSYLRKLSSVGSAESKTLAPEATTERVETLPAGFLLIASALSSATLRSDYRHRLLSLCSDVGLAADSLSGRSGADFLGPLLPAVAEICSDFFPRVDVEPSLLKLFRNLWFYIALFGLAPPIQNNTQVPGKSISTTLNSVGSMGALALQAVAGPYMWNTQWFSAVQRISQGTPPLVVSSVKWLEDELELNALYNPGSRRGSGNDKAAATQRSALFAALGWRVEVAAMSNVSGVKATYLLAVVYLEIIRFSSNGGILNGDPSLTDTRSAFRCVFEYLKTSNLMPDVFQCLTATVHQAFETAILWLDDRTSETGNEAAIRDLTLSAHACFLIKSMSQREEHIRDLSVKLLTRLREKFPQVLWNSSCLDALLFSVPNDPPSAGVYDPAWIATVRRLYQRVVREWIITSLSYAPCTSQGLLQEKLCKANTWQKAQLASDVVPLLSEIRINTGRNDCWSGTKTANIPAVMAAAAAASGANFKLLEAVNLEVLSTGIVSATVKSNHAGEIAGMRRLYDSISGIQPGAPQTSFGLGVGLQKLKSGVLPQQPLLQNDSFNEILLTKFVRLFQQFVNIAEKGEEVDKLAFHETCSQATALLLSNLASDSKPNVESFSQLLRLLCWCPAYISTPDAMKTGIFIWTWLISAAPALGSLVLAELVDAWLWTIDTKRGLFASEARYSGPAAKLRPHLAPGEPETLPEKSPVDQIIAHRLWLGFFIDRFEVIRHHSIEQVLLLGRMLQGTTKLPWKFSCHPAATGTFFTFMLLGLKFSTCQSQGNMRNFKAGVQLLEDRIYRASLGWFAHEPEWFDLNNIDFAQSEARSVSVFVHHLLNESMGVRQPESKGLGHENGSPLVDQKDQYHPVWGHMESYAIEREKWKQLLLMLCQHEVDRLEVWALPVNSKENTLSRPKITSEKWVEYAQTAFSVDPRIALSLASRFRANTFLKAEVTQMVQSHLLELRTIPEALPYIITPKDVDENSPRLQQLPHWAACSITQALEFLTPAYKGHPRVMAYVLRVLESYPPERVTFFMPQLIQALRYDKEQLVEGYLLRATQRSDIFAHILIWHLQGEIPESGKDAGSEKNGLFLARLPAVRQRIIDGFSPKALDLFRREFDFIDKVTSISGVLFPLPKEERRAGIRRELEKIRIEGDDLDLPTAHSKLVRGIQVDSGIPLQSAAKVPIMITFNVVDRDGDWNDIKPQACIFKVGDDCRQDVLALQVISLLKDIFEAVGLRLYLFPYGVLPTGPERGIIEVVPNTRSRSQMGETTDGGLFEIFQQDYGPVGSPSFEAARENFVISSAGYAVASLLLQPKDRHNGNLLFDNVGRLVHIDFGFILETSPGGNMRFESAHFKLSHEMTQLLDPSGAMKSDTWHLFVGLCVKGYLAVRHYMDGIINTVLLMRDSGLPCFSRGDPIGNLRKRFHPEMSEREAAIFMIRTCTDAYNKWTTAGYDLIQYLQQGIEK